MLQVQDDTAAARTFTQTQPKRTSAMKKAKQFLKEFSTDLPRGSVKLSVATMVYRAVNHTATLCHDQEEFFAEAICAADIIEFKGLDPTAHLEEVTRMALSLATYVNTCHED